jgi:hypothetical protein
MHFDLWSIHRVLAWIICLSILFVLPASLVAWYRSDRDRILDEADSMDTEVLSIRWCWVPFRYGPFSWCGSVSSPVAACSACRFVTDQGRSKPLTS